MCATRPRDRSIERLQQGSCVAPETRVRSKRARLLLAMKRPYEALADFDRVLVRVPKVEYMMLGRALAFFDLNSPRGRACRLREVLRRDPKMRMRIATALIPDRAETPPRGAGQQRPRAGASTRARCSAHNRAAHLRD